MISLFLFLMITGISSASDLEIELLEKPPSVIEVMQNYSIHSKVTNISNNALDIRKCGLYADKVGKSKIRIDTQEITITKNNYSFSTKNILPEYTREKYGVNIPEIQVFGGSDDIFGELITYYLVEKPKGNGALFDTEIKFIELTSGETVDIVHTLLFRERPIEGFSIADIKVGCSLVNEDHTKELEIVYSAPFQINLNISEQPTSSINSKDVIPMKSITQEVIKKASIQNPRINILYVYTIIVVAIIGVIIYLLANKKG